MCLAGADPEYLAALACADVMRKAFNAPLPEPRTDRDRLLQQMDLQIRRRYGAVRAESLSAYQRGLVGVTP